ncbi:MAG TPA: CDP-alcohol phosphatidyltransferase family protein [Ignavibacteriales bacterium]|nr:CDP-alcohol phosphatidyltransferase family protein [Ignavibacteriales bacterium]
MRTKKIKLKDVRLLSPLNNYRFNSFVEHFISYQISPLFTHLFIKLEIRPNTITLFMVISGIIGAILFSLPQVYFKFLGFLFFHLWFIFDCSDGEVARITKTFSKYGKEMDYIAHLINHPLMNLSLFISYLQFHYYNTIYLAILFMCFISMELINRNFTAFNTYLFADVNNKNKRSFLKYAIGQFSLYPNFILIFPIFVIADLVIGVRYSIYILNVWFLIYSLYFLKGLISTLIRFYRG